MPAVTPTLIMGVLGIVLSAPAWVLFIRAARRLYLFIAAGQPAPGRTNRPLRRGAQGGGGPQAGAHPGGGDH